MTKTEIKHLVGQLFDSILIIGAVALIVVFCWFLIINSDWKVDRVNLAAILEQRGGTVTSDGETIPLDYLTRSFYTRMTSYNMQARAINKKVCTEQDDSIVINIENKHIIINSALNGYALNLTWFDGERTRSYTLNTEMKFSTCKTQFFSSKIAYQNIHSK